MSSSLHVFRGASEFRRMKVRAGTRLSSREGALSGSGPGPQPSLYFLATLLCGWGGFTGSRTSASTVLDENRRLLTARPPALHAEALAMNFLKSLTSTSGFSGYTFGDRVDIDQSIWTLQNGTKRVRATQRGVEITREAVTDSR